MSDKIEFTLDGKKVTASGDETIWAVAKREGTKIPHLCHVDLPGYRPDGNCRACVVEVQGERTLAPSCCRVPTEGMVVRTDSPRAQQSRKMVLEMLLADMPAEELVAAIDFHGIRDAVDEASCLAMVKANDATRAERIARVRDA